MPVPAMNHQPELPMVAVTSSETDAEEAEADKDQKEDYGDAGIAKEAKAGGGGELARPGACSASSCARFGHLKFARKHSPEPLSHSWPPARVVCPLRFPSVTPRCNAPLNWLGQDINYQKVIDEFK